MSCGDYVIENGIIESTMLGFEDHGILTLWLHLKFDGAGQGFGGYCLDDPQRSMDFDDLHEWEERDGGRFVRRRGCAFGMDLILKILKTLGVERWENLPGTNLRVKRCHNKVRAIGHIYKDKWLDMEDHCEEWIPDYERKD